MAPPFEVPVATDAAIRWLWSLRQAPGAKAVYRQDLLKREILSYLSPMRFYELHEAVDAALSSDGTGEVRLVRNVTLPAPLNHRSLCNRHGSTILWAAVKEGKSLTLRSVGDGPWRIRHHVPGGNGAYGCALFCVGHRAQLRVEAVAFEIVCVPTANPVKASLAVLPPLNEPESTVQNVPDCEDVVDLTVDDQGEEVALSPAQTGGKECLWQLADPNGVRRAGDPNGAQVEISSSVEAKGYDSRLVVRGSWAFADCGPSQLQRYLDMGGVQPLCQADRWILS